MSRTEEEYDKADDLYDMAENMLFEGDMDHALKNIKEVLEINPHFMYAHILHAAIAGKMGKYNDSVHILKKAAELDPAFDLLYFLMSKYAFKAGDYPAAAKYINKACSTKKCDLYSRIERIITQQGMQLR